MKKVALTMLVIVSLLLITTTMEAKAVKLRVIVDKANVRLKPDINSMVVGSLPVGVILESKGKFGEWHQIDLPPDKDGIVVTGFISEQVVEVIGAAPAPVQPTAPSSQYGQKPTKKAQGMGIAGFGIKLGLSSSNLGGADAAEFMEETGVDLKSRLGFCFGGFVNFRIIELLSIQPEILLAMKGARIEEEVLGETLKAKAKLTYLEIPLLVRFNVPLQSQIKPYAYLGPSFAFKLSGKAWAEYAGEEDEEKIEDMKGTDFGLMFGAGCDFDFDFFGPGQLTFDLCYDLGLTTLHSPSGDEKQEDVKNRAFFFRVGYYF